MILGQGGASSLRQLGSPKDWRHMAGGMLGKNDQGSWGGENHMTVVLTFCVIGSTDGLEAESLEQCGTV